MAFHVSYSNLLSQLPPSLIESGWIRLTTRKRNPLSESEASSINPIIEGFLKHEVDRYQRKRQYRYNPTQYIQSENKLDSTKGWLISKDQIPSYCITTSINSEDRIRPKVTLKGHTSIKEAPTITYTEEEFNAYLKEESDVL
jgi:hypothetical protein